MIEVIAIVLSLGMLIGLLAWGFLLLLAGMQAAAGMFRILFDKQTLRRAFRSPIRFRLRTMLLAAGLLQVLFATVAWQQRETGEFGVTLLWLAGVSLVAWVIWVAFDEFVEPTASRRWKRVVRSDHVNVPDATNRARGSRRSNVEPPPRADVPSERTTTGD
jgi:hypothetical protein